MHAEIAKVIKEYYPIGIKSGTEEYSNYPSWRKLQAIIGGNIENYKSHIKPWKLFLQNLPKGYKSKVRNNEIPTEPSYSGKLTIERYEDDSMFRIKELVFNVSCLGNFYTIFGVDETVIKDEGLGYGYSAINVITVSPYREFEAPFNYLQKAVKATFKDHKFVPFLTCSAFIKNVDTPYSFGDDATVYECLFSGFLNSRCLPSIYQRGDRGYGQETGNFTVTLLPPPEA